MRRLVPCLALAALLVPAADVSAIPITNGYSTEGLGSFEADFSYSFSDSQTATVTITIMNTSSASNGGYITGIAFNNPRGVFESGLFETVTSVNLPDQFQLLPSDYDLDNEILADDTVSGQPFGYFDLGAALGGDFLGGPSPDAGIGVGETAQFTFNLTGTNLDSLSEQDFVNELSTGSTGQFFLARFRGFDDGGSDKVGGATSPPGDGDTDPGNPPPDGDEPPAPPAPEPAAVLFLTVGVLATGSLRRWLMR